MVLAAVSIVAIPRVFSLDLPSPCANVEFFNLSMPYPELIGKSADSLSFMLRIRHFDFCSEAIDSGVPMKGMAVFKCGEGANDRLLMQAVYNFVRYINLVFVRAWALNHVFPTSQDF